MTHRLTSAAPVALIVRPWVRGAVEPWSYVTVGPQGHGTVEPWDCGAGSPWDCGAVEHHRGATACVTPYVLQLRLGAASWSRGAVGRWSRGVVGPWGYTVVLLLA